VDDTGPAPRTNATDIVAVARRTSALLTRASVWAEPRRSGRLAAGLRRHRLSERPDLAAGRRRLSARRGRPAGPEPDWRRQV